MNTNPESIELYVGSVAHERIRPRRHAFKYRVFWTMIDIAQLDSVGRRSPLFSVDRWNVFSFRTADHGPKDGTSLLPWITNEAAGAGIDLDGGRVRLLSFPRLLGYAFNPLSIWYCENRDGRLAAVLYEVRNTFGESHSYLLPVSDDTTAVHEWDKGFFVSPFIDMNARYRFRIEDPAETLRVTVKESDADGHLFSASMIGQRRPATTKTLLSVFVTHPLMTLKVIVGIHWEALHLWRKGARYRSRPQPPAAPLSTPQGQL